MKYAVFLIDQDEYIAISYGDSEWECRTWIEDHKQYYEGMTLVVGITSVLPGN